MVSIKWEVNGRSVTESSFKTEFEKAIIKGMEGQIKKAIGSCVCKTHHQSPGITMKGKSLDGMQLSVAGCCDELIEDVKRKLK